MATIRKRTKKQGSPSWQVRWWQADGTQASETFTTEDAARRFRGLVDAAGQNTPDGWIRGHGFADASTSEWTVQTWCESAIDARAGITDQTRTAYRWQLKHLGDLADIDLADLSRADVSRWINSLDLAPKTVANLHGLLSSCLRDGVRDGHIRLNPAEGLRLPRRHGPDSHEIVALTTAEIDLILANTDEHYRPLIATLAGTGMRQAEAYGLQVRHVQLARRRISVTQALQRAPGGSIIGAPKTRRSVRSISITARLAEQLRGLVSDRDPEDYVFTTATGARIHPPRFRSHIWVPAVAAARRCDKHKDSDKPCGCKGTLRVNPNIHDLRHSHASYLIAAGVPLVKIQRRLGHESIQTTVDTYGHLLPDSDDEVISALEVGERSAPGALGRR